MSWGTRPKDIIQVTVEIFGSHPFLAYGDSPATIEAIGWIVWLGATRHHVVPAVVVRMKCPAINEVWMVSAGVATGNATEPLMIRREGFKAPSAVLAVIGATLPLVLQLACLRTVLTIASHLRFQDPYLLAAPSAIKLDSLCTSTLARSGAMPSNSLRYQPGERLSAVLARYVFSFTHAASLH